MANQWNNANILNLLSTGQANLMNMLSQTSAKAYNAKQAELARQWQRAMRQTAYQDTVEDMKKAGLNPILAAQNGATSTPSSSGASIGGTTCLPPVAGMAVACKVKCICHQITTLSLLLDLHDTLVRDAVEIFGGPKAVPLELVHQDVLLPLS